MLSCEMEGAPVATFWSFFFESRVIIIIITVITGAHWSFVPILCVCVLVVERVLGIFKSVAATVRSCSILPFVEIMSIIKTVVVRAFFSLLVCKARLSFYGKDDSKKRFLPSPSQLRLNK